MRATLLLLALAIFPVSLFGLGCRDSAGRLVPFGRMVNRIRRANLYERLNLPPGSDFGTIRRTVREIESRLEAHWPKESRDRKAPEGGKPPIWVVEGRRPKEDADILRRLTEARDLLTLPPDRGDETKPLPYDVFLRVGRAKTALEAVGLTPGADKKAIASAGADTERGLRRIRTLALTDETYAAAGEALERFGRFRRELTP